jgi:hypothetical protein
MTSNVILIGVMVFLSYTSDVDGIVKSVQGNMGWWITNE